MEMTPNPGSDAALDLGCICPVIDNSHGGGSGYTNEDGTPAFWITEGCEVHMAKKEKKSKKDSKRTAGY
jgi:hypothetical protein